MSTAQPVHDPATSTMLARLRVESLRARLAAAEIDCIGGLLSHRMITASYATEMLNALWGHHHEGQEA